MEGSEKYGNPAYRIHLDLQRLMMKALTNGGELGPDAPFDVTDGYEKYERVSPLGHVSEEVYRCPVSTPTVARRPGFKHNAPSQQFLTFNSMNHSLQIPDNITTAKHNSYKIANSKSKRAAAKAQKKNFDCYFVNRVEKPAHVDAQMKSTWLNALVSQPVDEIFGKYKRRTEASRRYLPARTVNSTPGEKALQNGWSSNASSRGSPSSLSRSTRSGTTSQQPRYSRTASTIDPNLRVYGFDQDPDRMLEQNGLALMPVSTPTLYDEDDESASPSASPVFHRVFRHNPSNIHYNSMGHSNISSNASIDSGMYEAYQRDKRFPEIRPRRSTFSPARKLIPSETREERPVSETAPSLSTLDLQESPMHIVSIGKLGNDSLLAEYDQYDNVTITKLPVPKKCPYRLPKNALTMSLPELHVTDS